MFWDRLGTFCTGFLAGVLATLLPPMVAMPAVPGGSDDPFPPAPYFLLALGVGLLIGLATLAISSRDR
jgi:hypothetical protein